MAILEQVQDDVKTAMKAGEKEKVQALRLVIAELQRAAKEGNDDEIAVLQTARKKRLESVKAFRDSGREEAAAKEQREAELIDVYLPARIGDDELAGIVAEAIEQTGASAPNDMGKVMGAVMPRVKGRADGHRVQAAVKAHLK
ncbi:MAG: GatB/YqeY domain-containing protein [Thermoleophilia bacterium]|nr:GatB/YqeY domain-containing protein [Thermoleophilia bacterium]